MNLEYWRYVARNVTSLVGIEDDERCMKILSLSYDSMPIHLKFCLLTLASYPEHERISVNKLIRFWIVNAFVKPKEGRGIEEVALDYLKDLVGRNMIFVRKFDGIMEVEELGVHDLLLNLCRKKSWIERVNVVNDLNIAVARCVGCSTTHLTGYVGTVPMKCCGRIFHQLRSILPVIPGNSACFCLECNKFEIREHFYSPMLYINFSSSDISICEESVPHFHGVVGDVVHFESLKHSHYHFTGKALWNVQEYAHYTQQLYEMMPQLRFSEYVPASNEGFVFEQLIRVDEYFEKPPKVSYGIFCSQSLRRLCIYDAYISQNKIRALKYLPSLHQLVFKKCRFSKRERRGNPLGFCNLKYLGISNSDLDTLIVRQIDFPRLVILWLHKVKNIGTLRFCDGLSGISSFQSMRLDKCGHSVVKSAKKTLMKKRSLGDESFYVKIDGRLLSLESSLSCYCIQLFPCLMQKTDEREGEFALFEIMVSKCPGSYYGDIEYQRRLPKAQQQEQMFIFGTLEERKVVKWDIASVLMFPNLKVLSSWRNEWDGYILPRSLKKLLLYDTSIDDERTKCIMELHNLGELIFDYCTFENEWCSLSEGKFNKLKFLQFEYCGSLKYLKLEEDQFPQLLNLGICDPYATLQISLEDICGISSLTSIRLRYCGDSIVQLALEIMRVKKEDCADKNFYIEVDNKKLSESEDGLTTESEDD